MAKIYVFPSPSPDIVPGENPELVPVRLSHQEYGGLTAVQEICGRSIPDIVMGGLRILSEAVRTALPADRGLRQDDLPLNPDLSRVARPHPLTPLPHIAEGDSVIRILMARLDNESSDSSHAISMLTGWTLSRVVRTGMLVCINSSHSSDEWPGLERAYEQRAMEAYRRLIDSLPALE